MKENKTDNKQMNSSDKRRNRTVMLILICAVTVVLVATLIVGFAFSWFAPAGSSADIDAKVTVFSTETKYRLRAEDVYETLNDEVKFFANSVGNINLQIEFKGESDAYIRVHLFESFKDADGNILPASDVSYTLAEGWGYKDGYYYYKDIVKGNNTTVEIPFVTSATIEAHDPAVTYADDSYYTLVSTVESVQPDRFKAFFGFSPEDLTTN